MIFPGHRAVALAASSRVSRSRNCLLVLKYAWYFSLTETLSPVAGLWPMRAELGEACERRSEPDLVLDYGNYGLVVI